MRKTKPFLIAVLLLIVVSCSKDRDCYDEQLMLEYRDRMCTMDCPGVTGCDGKTYCNECEANRKGIRVEK